MLVPITKEELTEVDKWTHKKQRLRTMRNTMTLQEKYSDTSGEIQ
jgi:hypothetical protein